LPQKRLSEPRGKSTLLEKDEEGEWVERVMDKPKKVHAATRFGDDAYALRTFFSRATPPTRVIRATAVMEVFYGFADASGEGFGGSFSTDGGRHGRRKDRPVGQAVAGSKLVDSDLPAADVDEHVYYRFGQWCTEDSEESSNYRELKNLWWIRCDVLLPTEI
jgi:hypothetical protein